MAGNKRSRSVSSSDTSNSQSEGRRSPKRLQKGRNRSRSRDRYRYPRDSRDRSREHRNSRRYDDDRRHDNSDRHVSRRARSPETRRPEPSDRSLGDRHRSHHRDQLDARPASDGPPDLLSIHRAKVQSVRPFGVFVALAGYRRHGMVHSSQVSSDLSFSRDDEDEMKVKAMDFYATTGSEVWVKVTEIREEGNGNFKIACSMKAVSQDDGTDADPSNAQAGGSRAPGGFRGPISDMPPELGSVQKAIIRSIKPYGVFVQMEGFRSNALVHLSQVADHMEIDKEDTDEAKIAAVGAVVAIGEQVYVKVVEVKEDDGSGRGPKIGASIKLVSQKDGRDMDPQNTKFQPRGEGGPPGQGGRRPVGAQAGATAGGKIEWGHLAAGDSNLRAAFETRQGQHYDMVEDDADTQPAPLSRAGPSGANLAPLGRGQDATKPAWMTHPGGLAAPGSTVDQPISSVEQALAILAAGKHSKKSKKDKKHKKEKKEKHAKHKHKHKS